MNKGRRTELTKLKFKKRIKILGITSDNYCYKTTSKPCSCAMCSPKEEKKKYKVKHKKSIYNE